MFELTFPVITSVEIVAAQSKPADLRNISYIRARDNSQIPDMVYLIKIYVEEKPSISNMGLSIYLGDYKLRKYGEFSKGFYIKTPNSRFLREHAGAKIRFSIDGYNFYESDQYLPSTVKNLEVSFSLLSTPEATPDEVSTEAPNLPTQKEALAD